MGSVGEGDMKAMKDKMMKAGGMLGQALRGRMTDHGGM